MAAKKKVKIEKTVDEIFFERPIYRRPVAGQNVRDALKHTLRVLEKARKKKRQ